ncbi:MAG: glycosyltransferase family 25 protein, partial [Acidomyces sp. 'richmondensis']
MLAHRNSKRSPTIYIVLASAIIVSLLLLRPGFATDVSSKLLPARLKPANATMGFGGLFVVSGPGSPRRQHLEEAARVTGLDFRIPEQVAWTEEDVRNFRPVVEEESHVLTGSVKAWLSHHVVLREFLSSGLETAVVFEDDVDWDIRLLTEQIPLAQKAVRSMSKSMGLDQERYPWGTPDDWDLLYIGHCGDYFGDIQTQSIG